MFKGRDETLRQNEFVLWKSDQMKGQTINFRLG